jgi:hypothetical protein
MNAIFCPCIFMSTKLSFSWFFNFCHVNYVGKWDLRFSQWWICHSFFWFVTLCGLVSTVDTSVLEKWHHKPEQHWYLGKNLCTTATVPFTFKTLITDNVFVQQNIEVGLGQCYPGMLLIIILGTCVFPVKVTWFWTCSYVHRHTGCIYYTCPVIEVTSL